jgi:hypothetical protein
MVEIGPNLFFLLLISMVVGGLGFLGWAFW